MNNYKKYNNKRRYKKRAYVKPLRYKVADMAYQAYRGVSYLKGLVNAELHHYENTTSGTAISSTGHITNLTPISVGDNNSNRTGNSVLSKYLFGRMEFGKSSSASQTFIRIIIFCDQQQVADTAPAVADVLSSASTLSPLNSFQVGRFKILKDMVIRLDSNNTTYNEKINIKLPFHTKFNGTSGTDVQKNGVYILAISNEATNTPSYSYNLRYSFYDN